MYTHTHTHTHTPREAFLVPRAAFADLIFQYELPDKALGLGMLVVDLDRESLLNFLT